MTAFTRLPDGRTVRWHADLSECDRDTCQERHVERDELFDPIAFTAGAMCAASEPHRAPGDDWPCEKCLAHVRSASAVASTGGSTSQTDHRPGTLNPEPAYRPNDLGQKQV